MFGNSRVLHSYDCSSLFNCLDTLGLIMDTILFHPIYGMCTLIKMNKKEKRAFVKFIQDGYSLYPDVVAGWFTLDLLGVKVL